MAADLQHFIKDLISGQSVPFRVRAGGMKTEDPWTDPGTKIAPYESPNTFNL